MFVSEVLIWLGLLCVTVCGVLSQEHADPCEDLDSQSCAGFQRARPDLCSDPTFSQSVCRRFCGNCPLECYSCPNTVRHPRDCNTTETCDPSMECVTKHLRATDGRHDVYLMRCESKELCALLTDGLGKRHIDDIDTLPVDQHHRYERDVVLNCCNKDLCNYEMAPTTTAMAPPTADTTTTARPTTTRVTTIPVATTTTPAPPTTTPFCDRDDCGRG